MSQTVTAVDNTLAPCGSLDCSRFDSLSSEAMRLIRARRRQYNGKHSRAMRAEVKDLQEVTTAALNGRLSASQR